MRAYKKMPATDGDSFSPFCKISYPTQPNQQHSARALRRFVCAGVFPECPHEGVGVKSVCRPTCREAEAACGLPLACDFFQSKDCTHAGVDMMVEDGFFMLKDDQGPYEPLPYLYGGLLGVWLALSLVWVYNVRFGWMSPYNIYDEIYLPHSIPNHRSAART